MQILTKVRPVHGVCVCMCVCVCVCVLSHVLLSGPLDCGVPGSSVMEFSRQEYWSGLPFPAPGDLPNPGTESGSPALQEDSLPAGPPEKTQTGRHAKKK